jgi:hypothetical protein
VSPSAPSPAEPRSRGGELVEAAEDESAREYPPARGFPVLYFHPYELGSRALRLALPRGTSLTVRAGGAWKTVRYNPGRGRVVELLAEAAERFHLMPCGEALQEVEDSMRAAAAPVTA